MRGVGGYCAHLRKWPLTPGKPVSCPDKKDETEKKGAGVRCVCQYSISRTATPVSLSNLRWVGEVGGHLRREYSRPVQRLGRYVSDKMKR